MTADEESRRNQLPCTYKDYSNVQGEKGKQQGTERDSIDYTELHISSAFGKITFFFFHKTF